MSSANTLVPPPSHPSLCSLPPFPHHHLRTTHFLAATAPHCNDAAPTHSLFSESILSSQRCSALSCSHACTAGLRRRQAHPPFCLRITPRNATARLPLRCLVLFSSHPQPEMKDGPRSFARILTLSAIGKPRTIRALFAFGTGGLSSQGGNASRVRSTES